MKTRFAGFASLGAVLICMHGFPATAQVLQLANPHWNITLSDYGYSDFMLDNTPGFEGREYLSGEWAGAVGYQVSGGATVTPQWLEPQFIFPDWATLSPFHVVTPITQTGVNADGLPIAQSVIANAHVEITLRHEMIDTVTGTPMGTTPSTATGEVTSVRSDRYILKQVCSIRNIAGTTLTNLQFFQFLHGLQSQWGAYDSRLHAGPLSEFRHDVTQAGVDAFAVGAGSSTSGLEDYIAFHANRAPSAFEIGYYGVEGNGVDGHGIGKPSEGVHLSIENNWQTAPYASRAGRDYFAPPQRWIGGAQRWDLGSILPGQTATHEIILSLLTGTRVPSGTNQHGGCNGGSSVPGGIEYEFEDVSVDGAMFGDYSRADGIEVAQRIAEGEFDAFTFLTPGGPVQLWELEFSGTFSGNVHLTIAYDPTILPPGFNEETLVIHHFDGGAWRPLTGNVDANTHTITTIANSLGYFALGVEGGTSFAINASPAPANSGVILGTGSHANGANATLVAVAATGYAFSNWTENGAVVSTSPAYTFQVESNRTLAANFSPGGTGIIVGTASMPTTGGTTAGDGAYAAGSSATVTATPNPGYKFSKWMLGNAIASNARIYTFPVESNVTLTAKFKPVYTIGVTVSPAAGGEVEVDAVYEFGELAKLKAIPNNGYCFVNWTQNGLPVCKTQDYSFTVTASRELVANFAFGTMVTVLAEPANAGSVLGGGVFPTGGAATIEAVANPGYAFVNWTDNGLVVSSDAIHTFNANVSCTMVANFITQPSLASVVTGPGTMIVSWPAAATGWVLEESADLSGGSWVGSTRMISIVDGRKEVTVPTGLGMRFFRLSHP